jgi:transposase-like protein
MAGYYDLELNPDLMPVKARHTLNKFYRGARKFELHAPDAEGTLLVWARSEEEAQAHLQNALFDLIFRSARLQTAVKNPKCLFCGGRTQRGGRNSSGTRVWACQNVECRRSFVLDRTFRGGINHPSQSKKPAFVRLLQSGATVREAADKLSLNVSTAGNWAEVAAGMGLLDGLECPCGKSLRHRGSCAFRQGLMPTRRLRDKGGQYLPGIQRGVQHANTI